MKIQDLSLWEAFYWVAEEKSFTKAAVKMRLGVPFLSKKIGKLEAELGMRLFHRSTRKVSLTSEGIGLLPTVKTILEDLHGIENHFEPKDQLSGVIRLTCLTSIAHRILAPLLVEFTKMHPKVIFELDASDRIVDLIDNQIDLAIRVQEPTGADYIFRKLLQNDLIFCASPDFLRKSKGKIQKLSDLKNHPFFMLDAYAECRLLDSKIRLKELRNTQTIKCDSGMFLTELALQGGGIAVRSLWDVQPFLKSGELVQILKNYPIEPYGNIYAVIPSRRYLSHRVRTFLEYLSEKTIQK